MLGVVSKMVKALRGLALAGLVGMLVTVGLAGGKQASADQIVAGAFPPFRYIDILERPAGIDYEVIAQSYQIMGEPLTFNFMPFLRAMDSVRLGDALAIAALTKNEEREAFLLSSEEISQVRDVFFTQQSSDLASWSSFDDLRFLRVGKSKGYNYHESFQEFPFLDLTEMVPSDTGPELALMQMLAIDRLDVAICEATVCGYLLSTSAELGQKVRPLEGSIGPVRSFHLAFSKAHPDATQRLAAFNMALRQMRESGSLSNIHARYGLVTAAIN